IDDDRPRELEHPALERLQVALAIGTGPARIGESPQYGVPPTPAARQGLVAAAEPGGLDEIAVRLFLQEHFPAIGQVAGAREIDTPLGREGHLPAERHDLAGVSRLEFEVMP